MLVSLLTTSLLIHALLSPQEFAEAKRETHREIVLEVPGITCVGRFKSSLHQHFVERFDGVHGVTFHYFSTEPDDPRNIALEQAKEAGTLMFGGWGRLTFRVDADFDDRKLLQALAETRLYTHTDLWILVRRTPLSEFLTGESDDK